MSCRKQGTVRLAGQKRLTQGCQQESVCVQQSICTFSVQIVIFICKTTIKHFYMCIQMLNFNIICLNKLQLFAWETHRVWKRQDDKWQRELRPGLVFESGAEEDLCTFLTGLDGFFSFTFSRSAGLCLGFVLSAVKDREKIKLVEDQDYYH